MDIGASCLCISVRLLHSPYTLHCVNNVQVARSHVQSDGLLGDYCDGSLFKEHPLFSTSESSNELLALQFILYYDEVEVTNPLSSSRGKHKLGN